jgi:hypothetical protein
VFGLFALTSTFTGPAWGEDSPVMTTRWTELVSPTNVHAEYPRPQFVREHWLNLNGLWDYAITTDERTSPQKFEGKILVPFPIESRLSGVARRLDERSVLWYRRHFTVPPAWKGQRIQLHFGAVDWSAKVYLNGRELGSHRGGYDAFSFDLTPAIDREHENELLVAVKDPTEGDQPRGKQSRKPEGIFYSPSSGIWQTVWLEPVPPTHLTGVRLIPDFAAGAVQVCAMANGVGDDLVAETVVRFAGEEVGRVTGAVGAASVVNLRLVRPWSPAEPQLYDVTVKLRRGTTVLDEAGSYFGLREIHVAADERGLRRLFLNGRPMFQMGVLDQGFWPDGLYTAPTDEALRSDLEMAKSLGFNLVRKHVKVEPERWYYWADRLGLLVWQDMPSANNASEEGRRSFRMELERMIEQRGNHPGIVMWVLFNEGWGQFDTERLVRWLKAVDPTRLVNNASGWTDAKAGDVIDLHSYPEPIAPTSEGMRAGVLGEFGGLGLPIEGHTWSQKTWGYQPVSDSDKLTERYCALLDKVWMYQQTSGLAAAIYTQLTDVETECNGFLTYDRRILKVNSVAVHQANSQQPFSTLGDVLLPNAQQGSYSWHYTTKEPAESWMQPEFDASAWKDGAGGFGSTQTPGAIVNTTWTTSDIWLRREFTLPEVGEQSLNLVIHHDEDAEVYLNGVPVAHLKGFNLGYVTTEIPSKARSALKVGRNLIAVHCHQTSGGQFIDVGILGQAKRQ